MPQMNPMNWSLLFMYFLMLFLMTLIINNSLMMYKPMFHYKFTKMMNMMWKW
uniref:ATP synthase F0 subunit 8 n=1 Tax=Sphaerotheriidae sp. HYS-2012 TaxID=1170231 RepID=I6PDL2_9MYRI|nr:ATP synthase F0 subunit 8 [Sphaerotheriidae sp. HYS-2012]AFH54814.1 ATP synthase F0 subunit 8 [Sphaerotheriidae sp. HYS-2012]